MTANRVGFSDIEPAPADFLNDVLAGLSRPHKCLPPKYFYDGRGSRLFEAICESPEYYPTRTETAILQRYAPAIAEAIGPSCLLIEPGAGSVDKVRWLLDLLRPALFLPLDISGEHLLGAARALVAEYPWLRVHAVAMDYTRGLQRFDWSTMAAGHRKIVFFPGSTIGNFDPPEALDFLRQVARLVAPDGGLLIGVDLKKDPVLLHRAYNDTAGITREFNLNLLRRINADLGGDFDPDSFHHYAYYHVSKGRVEMHLVSRADQTVRIGGQRLSFREGESIHTENSYKYTLTEFGDLAARAGLRRAASWIDPANLFSVQYFVVKEQG